MWSSVPAGSEEGLLHQKTHLAISRWAGLVCGWSEPFPHLYGNGHHHWLVGLVLVWLIRGEVVPAGGDGVNPPTLIDPPRSYVWFGMKDRNLKLASQFHRSLYQLTGGLLGTRLVNNDMLLLTTTGHRTGKRHTVPLLYLSDMGRYVVIASYGGRPQNPAWYTNLVANPEVEVQIGRRRFAVTARTADPDERAALWPLIVDAYKRYAEYQARTDREVPVVYLDPVES